ncbi:MAG: PIN domain-containing protein [Planctomycetes bacterium]|nr:PIN domain-containing protein [Planctomycetota bacterium]
MGYLFDTDAISDLGKPRPLAEYVRWLAGVPAEDQFTCAPVIGELFAGAFAVDKPSLLARIRDDVVNNLVVLPFGTVEAEQYGKIRAALEQDGQSLHDLDLQIAACAMTHGLDLVTGNRKHFERLIPLGLSCCWVFADARAASQDRPIKG